MIRFLAALILILLPFTPAAAETLRIGTEADYAPFIFVDDKGRRAGFDVEMMDDLCALGGYDCIWIEQPFPQLFEGLSGGLYDIVVGGIGDGQGREVHALFTRTYLALDILDVQIVALDPGADPETGVIGVLAASSFADELTTRNYAARAFESLELATEALFAGEVEMMIAPSGYLAALPYTQRTALILIAEIETTTGGPQIGVARDRPDLVRGLDLLLAQMKSDGTLAEMREVWWPTN